MNEEIFDLVDEHDAVIGQLSRKEVHRQGLRHRAVHILVFNSSGEIFLQKRSLTKDTFPGRWDSSAAGHLDCGEDYDACAIREVHEELGHKMDSAPQRILRLTACAETGQEFVWVYRHECDGPFTLHPEEIEKGEWFTPAEVTRWMGERPEDFAPAFISIWRQLFNEGPLASSK